MITGKIKNQADSVWKIFWEGGIKIQMRYGKV